MIFIHVDGLRGKIAINSTNTTNPLPMSSPYGIAHI